MQRCSLYIYLKTNLYFLRLRFCVDAGRPKGRKEEMEKKKLNRKGKAFSL